jgi:tRNA pseudouridine38-40 synthase
VSVLRAGRAGQQAGVSTGPVKRCQTMPTMPTFKIVLAYDGTDFVGWQRQASGISIQGLVEDALRALDERHVPVAGAGRTDAGVHALGQVATFSLNRSIACDALARALNSSLPLDIRVISVEEATATFHARFGAHTKTYRYRIWNADVMSPFERRYAWHAVGRLDVGAMAKAARILEGRHDFAAFQASGNAISKTERELLASTLSSSELRGGELIVYDVTGNGFLRHMVRTIVGTLVEVGRGKQPPEWVSDVIASRDRSRAGQTAPACGLFLVRVEYDRLLAAGP